MYKLKPLAGVDDIRFGCSSERLTEYFGEPEEINIQDNYRVLEYYNKGIAFFFDLHTDRLHKIEIEDSDVQLWDSQIMHEASDKLYDLIVSHCEYDIKVIDKPFPTLMFVIDALALELSFEDKKLVTVTAAIRN